MRKLQYKIFINLCIASVLFTLKLIRQLYRELQKKRIIHF